MPSGEIDLRQADDALLELIHTFAAGINSSERRPRDDEVWSRFGLTGVGQVALQMRFEQNDGLLLWCVRARPATGAQPVDLRYAMRASELGDIWSDRPRCEVRLQRLAEAHLRADLHLIRHGYLPVSSGKPTFIRHNGWAG